MTTINSTMTAKEAYEAALNDPIARIINKSSLEDIIKTHRGYAVWYARDLIKGRWVEVEDSIKTSPQYACLYATEVIRGRWIEGEDAIKTSPTYAFRYAQDVIKGEWPEGESIIATDPDLSYNYCYRVTQNRCKTIEKYILEKRLDLVLYKPPSQNYFYNYANGGGVFQGSKNEHTFDIEPAVWGGKKPAKHIQEAIKCYYYAVDNIKGRWIEAEDIIKQFDTAWSMYQEFLATLPLTDDEWAEKVQNECKNMLLKSA